MLNASIQVTQHVLEAVQENYSQRWPGSEASLKTSIQVFISCPRHAEATNRDPEDLPGPTS